MKDVSYVTHKILNQPHYILKGISVNQLMQYRAVKCFDVPQQFVIDAIEAYPYLELLGGQVRRKPIDSSIHVARNKESPGVDPPLSNSGGTIFYLDFGSKAGNSHHQEGASNNGDKMKTPMKQILDNTNRADYVRHTHEVLGAESDTPQQGSRRFSLAGRCFNCGGDHKVNECTESFDAHRVRVNRNSMAELNSKRSPKHDFEADVRFWNSGHDVTKMQPGKASLSDNLRIALQLKDGEPFPWIDRMRDYGPPPYLFRRKELPVDLIKIYHNPESDEEVNSNHEPEEKSFAVAATSTADQDECISMDEDSDENDVYDNNSPVPVMVAAPRGKTIASPIPVTLPTSAMNQIPKVSSAVPEPTTPVPVPKLPYAVFRQSMPPSVSYTATPVWGQPSSYYHQHYSSSPVRAGHYSLDPAHGHHDHSYHGYYGPMYPPPLVPHHPHPPPPLSDPSPPPPPPPSAHIPSD
ncbi:hypothetical protein BJ742DRAFT_222867 [Cladochytrium replicatum]|nr:hypothetical protein BJ742DRAFT_222867 [Cladochytrium replicatum]